jgi:phage terminase small subunit
MTPKQEKFCQLYVELGSGAAAYRGAYKADRMKPETVHQRAHDLLQNSKVKVRIETIREAARERNKITVDTLLLELEEARQAALCAGTVQSAAAVGATMGKAKLLGLDKQILDLRSSDGSLKTSPTVIKIVAADDNSAD